MQKRKGMMSLEMLLVIGAIIAGLGSTFALNKKLNSGMNKIHFAQELKGVIMGIEHQHRKFKGYPKQEQENVPVGDTPIYDPQDLIIKAGAAGNWDYKTISLTEEDNLKYSSGNVFIKIHNGSYSETPTQEIIAHYYNICQNARFDVDATSSYTINRISDRHDWCLLKENVKIFALD